ncbi:MAG: hypothetical protein ACRDQB_11720 [Thermocrispum sp.]
MTLSGTNGYQTTGAGQATAFSQELRAAIKASGLGLDRIQARLRGRGIPVSVTALSYWQSGKRQPERARSISAVHALEVILQRPAGSLVRLLQPPRPRGQAARRPRAASPLRRTAERAIRETGRSASAAT